MPTDFADLDELVLRCRDAAARANIKEAVFSYRAGAYRSAIVATWVAVAYDYLAKLKELALAGDTQAQIAVEEFERLQAAGDLVAALRWERALLKKAHSVFELLSHTELVDLERLQADRNRCAHPSMASAETHYRPTAELARTHIRNAVDVMLALPPLQGKAALSRILTEIESKYFPSEVSGAVTHFQHGPLFRPRSTLVRNVTIVLLKKLLDPANRNEDRYSTALQAMLEMHPTWGRASVQERLPDLARARMSTDVEVIADLVCGVPQLWSDLPQDVQQIVEAYVAKLPPDELLWLESYLATDCLRSSALKRLSWTSAKDLLSRFPWSDTNPDILNRKIQLYAGAETFNTANELGKALAEDARGFNNGHVDAILDAIGNSQVRGSFELKKVLNAIIDAELLSESELTGKLAERGFPAMDAL